MFSPEFMSYLIKYQGKEYLPDKKNYIELKNSESKRGIHRFTKFAVVPITLKR